MTAKIFFSYSHADEDYRDKLETHLSALKHQGLVSTWHDRRIPPGDEFDRSISAELEKANIILLLISPEFIASPYCYGIETQQALKRHEAGEARVIPVVLRPCDWHGLPFGQLLALPTDGKPITKWPDLDEAFLDVVRGIKKALGDIGSIDSASSKPAGQAGTKVPNAPVTRPGPRSSNLRLAKTFTDRDKDKYLHDAFVYMGKFFENSLLELESRNPGIEGSFRRSGESRFTAAIYRNGDKVRACTIYIGRDLGGAEIRFSHGEHDSSSGFNESLIVDHDDQMHFLRPMGMLNIGGSQDQKLTSQGGAELFWSALIEPLQQ